MEARCIQSRKELPDMEEFKKAVQPLIEWVNKNCNTHERVVVEMGYAQLVSEEMGFSFEVPDRERSFMTVRELGGKCKENTRCIGCKFTKECNELDKMLLGITPEAVLDILDEEIYP